MLKGDVEALIERGFLKKFLEKSKRFRSLTGRKVLPFPP